MKVTAQKTECMYPNSDGIMQDHTFVIPESGEFFEHFIDGNLRATVPASSADDYAKQNGAAEICGIAAA